MAALTLVPIPDTDLAYVVSDWSQTTDPLPSDVGAYQTELDVFLREQHRSGWTTVSQEDGRLGSSWADATLVTLLRRAARD